MYYGCMVFVYGITAVVSMAGITHRLPVNNAYDMSPPCHVQINGIMIVQDPQPPKCTLRTFDSKPGTRLSVGYRIPNKTIVAFADNRTTLQLRDDKGLDIPLIRDYWHPKYSICGTGAFASMELVSKQLPTTGARSLQLQGSVAIKCASKTESTSLDDVELQQGTMIKAGAMRFTITQIGESLWSNKPLEIVFETKDDLDALKSITFYSEDGAKITSERSLEGTTLQARQVGYSLDKNIKRSRLVFTYWEDMDVVNVPIDLVITMGLSPDNTDSKGQRDKRVPIDN